jgi:hypothetical protein
MEIQVPHPSMTLHPLPRERPLRGIEKNSWELARRSQSAALN